MESLVRWVISLGATQPVLLVLEDAHWCDPSSLELFRMLIARAHDSKVLVLITARNEFEPEWVHSDGLFIVRLDRLTESEALHMLGHLNRSSAINKSLARAIVERADGNPLYLEELVRAMLNPSSLPERAGQSRNVRGPDVVIPATLQDSLAERLDRLGSAREVAQRAAVIGREFPYALVSATAGFDAATLQGALQQLVEAGLVFADGKPPQAIYAFKHALIQEAAYASLLRRTRQQLHGRVARAILENFPQRVEVTPEVVARHYEAAGEVASALDYYQRAGEQAAARSACEEAVVHLRNALRLLQTLPDGPLRTAREIQLQVALGAPLVALRGFPDPETFAAYERALTLCDSGGEVSAKTLASGLGGLSMCLTSRGQFDRGIACAERLLRIPVEPGDDAHLLLAHLQIAVPQFLQARFNDAIGHCDQVIARYNPLHHADNIIGGGVDHGVGANIWSAWALWFVGRPDSAVKRCEAALALAREIGHQHSLSVALLWKTMLHYWRREAERTCELALETITVSEQQGFAHWAGIAKAYRGAAMVANGAGAEVLTDVVDGLEQAARAHQGGATCLYVMLAEAYGAVGEFDRAFSALEQGSSIAKLTGQPLWDPEFKRIRGELQLCASSESKAEAETLFRDAFQQAIAIGAQSLALRAATSLGRLLAGHRNRDEPRELLLRTYNSFSEGFDAADLTDARTLLERLQ
jgi:tetratricopeptide (TPR) repeat protein